MSSWGSQVEDYARQLAAGLGVADFVYVPKDEQKGSGQRELSDGILAVGDDGLIVQVKARDPSAGATDDAPKAERWIRKHAEIAKGQADGVRRRLSSVEPVVLESLRGYEREFSSSGDWPAVVVVEHPLLPAAITLDQEAETLWITLDDWHGLHERLRSTAAVVQYVRRALLSGLHPPLGGEQARYDVLAQADTSGISRPHAIPMLPMESLDANGLRNAAFVEQLMEFVSDPDGFRPWTHPDEYRRIVEDLDRIPPAARSRLGAKMLATFRAMVVAGQPQSFTYWEGSQSAVFLFRYDLIDNWSDMDDFVADVGALAAVRLEEAGKAGKDPTFALGVGVLDHGRGRSYWYAHIEPPFPVPAHARFEFEQSFGVFDGEDVVRLPEPGRNDRCPCESGRKYKMCHGKKR